MGKNYTEDERVIGAFLNNFRMVDVMKETGLSKSTVYKIRNDQKFQKVIRERKEAILKTAVNQMQSYMLRDVEVLQEIIDDPETPKQVRINAINTKWAHMRDWTRTTDIMKDLSALKETSENVFETF